jgi:fibronectin-binding autotransporter adhesin
MSQALTCLLNFLNQYRQANDFWAASSFGRIFALSLGIMFIAQANGIAAAYNWNTTTGGTWDISTTNWTGGGTTWVDGTGNTATFNNTANVSIITNSGSRSAGAITVGSTANNNANFSFTGGTSLSGTSFTVQGNAGNGPTYSSNPSVTNNVPTVSIAGDAAVGRANLNITGGSFSANRIISAAGAGAADWSDVVISGGTVYATNGVVGNANTTATFQLDLNGGTLYTPSLTVADRESGGNAVLNLNGTTIVATANTATFVTLYGGSQNIIVGNGGAIINTFDGATAHSITITPILKPAASSTGGLTKQGAGTLTLAGANTYTGRTTISTGTLALASTGSIASTTNITVASGAAFDVSAKAGFTLGASQVLSGSSTNNGSVNTTSGTKVYAGDDATGVYATNRFNNNFTNVTGALLYLDLGTVYNGSNDLINVGGTLALNSTVFHLKAPSASVNLDTTSDYVLASAAGISGSPSIAPIWDVSPLNAGNYTIYVTNGTQVVLHYVPYNPPTAGMTASPNNLVIGQKTTLTVIVTNGTSPTISSVVLNASAIGAGSSVTLVSAGGNLYTNTVTVGSGVTYGNQTLTATVTDANGLNALPTTIVFVHAPRNLVWNNGAATGNWNTSDTNWTGFAWDNLDPDNAAFTTVAGVVSLTTPITAGTVTYGTTSANSPDGTLTNGSLAASSLTVQGSSANNGSSGISTYSSEPTLTVNVPTVSIAGDVSVGRANLNITGGSFSANRIISAAGAGAADWSDVFISGGTVYVTNGVVGGANTTATFQLDLNGGTLYTPFINVADREVAQNGPAVLNWNGTTVVATADTNAFVTLYGGSQNTYVGTNGAIINTFDGTTAHSITITPNLLPATASTGGLTKLGAGTLTLAGANTYTGNTTISNGVLALSGTGSISNSANIVVGAGGTFAVSGVTFATSSGQTLKGTGATGTLNGNVDMTVGSLAVTYTNGTPTLTETNGTLTMNNNTVTVTVQGGTPLPPNNTGYKLISAGTAGTVAGSVSSSPLTVNGAGAAAGHATSLSIVSGELYLVVTNHAPVAGSSFTMNLVSGTASTVAIVNGKNAPSDADGDTLTITSVVGATNGVVTTDGTNVTYTATNGTADSFTYTVSDGNGGSASQTVQVVIDDSSGAQTGYNYLSIQSVGGNVVLSYAGIPDYNYALDETHNLTSPVTWTPVVTNTAASNGRLTFTNTPSGGSDFYRTRYVP